MIESEPKWEVQNSYTWELMHQQVQWGKNADPRIMSFIWREFGHTKRDDIHILDVGCGVGAQSFYAADSGHTVVGIDCSVSAIERAKRHNDAYPNLTFMVGHATKLPFADASFDAVVEVLCLQYLHIEETRQALSEIRRVLKPDGVFCSLTEAVGSVPRYTQYISSRQTSEAGVKTLYGQFFDITQLRCEKHIDMCQKTNLWWIIEARRKP